MTIACVPEKYRKALEILSKRFDLDAENFCLILTEEKEMRVFYDGRTAEIFCNEVNQFARLFGILAEKYRYGAFEVVESPAFRTLSCMLDVSYGTPLTVKSIKEYLEYMALFGFNQLQFYMEDMYEIEGRPYFGYMRGRYSKEELREIDDYAYALGIEVVPCIETLGHMSKYLCWPEARSVRDTSGVLLADSEPTYEFIGQMLDAATSPFRSRKIHIGCDETYGLGSGTYLKNGGKKSQIDLFLDHVARVCELCEQRGLQPMMWSDMLCSSFSKGGGNWNSDINIPSYVGERLPKNLDLVFWHYGQIKGAESYMIPKHRAIGKNPIFAGASHIWQTYLPDLNFSLLATESSLSECKKLGTAEVMITVWNYPQAIYQASLLDLCQYGELTYSDGEGLRERFEFLTGASYDAFLRMSDLGHTYRTETEKKKYVFGRNEDGNAFVVTDLLLNVKQKDWQKESRTDFYRDAREYFLPLRDVDDEWRFLYEFSYSVFDMMYRKSLIAEALPTAYSEYDLDMLSTVAKDYIPEYLSALERLSDAHAYHRDYYLRPFGGETMDAIYGKMKERARTAKRRIELYLDGMIPSIDELEAEKLDYQWGIFF